DALAGRRRRGAHTLSHDLDRYQFDGLLGAGAVAIGALVLTPESVLQIVDHLGIEGPLGNRDGEIEALPGVVRPPRRAPARPCPRESLAFELRQRLAGERAPGGLDLGEIGAAQAAPEGARIVMLHLGPE